MQLISIIQLLNGKAHCCETELTKNITKVYAGDLLSELLIDAQERSLLLTGLVNLQVIRTAEMLDLSAIVFTRGKTPLPAMIALATKTNIPLITTSIDLFHSCGLLYEAFRKDGEYNDVTSSY